MIDLTGYRLTFDEEFDSRSISQTGSGTTWADIRSEWRFDTNSDIGFGHSSFLDPASGYDPFTVEDGVLAITAVPDRTPFGFPGSWESGLITTQGNFAQTYGYFEMRADMADGVGGWDGFWMLPVTPAPNPNNRPGWQELDIVEHYGAYNQGTYRSIHTTDPFEGIHEHGIQVFSDNPEQLSGFHTYGMDWGADEISFYFDGRFMGSAPTPSDMHGPMYILANLATQADADVAAVPITMRIDYIRAYARGPDPARNPRPRSDFNADGHSDILLQGGGGVVAWFMNNGAYAGASTVAAGLPAGWSVVGTGDFNGDGSSDLVLQGGSTLAAWFLDARGHYAGGHVVNGTPLPSGWSVVGTGDVNGDGVTDLVLQGGNVVVDWVLNASGGYQTGNTLATDLPPGWHVAGVGDLSGDGIADLVLQNGSTVVDWLLNSSGGYAGGHVISTTLPLGWSVRALGDVDGDGTSDLVLQGGSSVVDWLMSNGQYASGNVLTAALPAGWNVTGTGDYNGDGTADISLQGGSTVVDWLMSNGQYAGGNVVGTGLAAGWSVVGKT